MPPSARTYFIDGHLLIDKKKVDTCDTDIFKKNGNKRLKVSKSDWSAEVYIMY